MRITRVTFCAALLLLSASRIWATVGPPVNARLTEQPAAAKSGSVLSRTIEIEVGADLVLTNLHLAGEGWSILESDAPQFVSLKKGDVLRVQFTAMPTDPNKPLGLSYDAAGQSMTTWFDFSQRAYERSLGPGSVRTFSDVPSAPAQLDAGETPGLPFESMPESQVHDKSAQPDESYESDSNKKAAYSIRVRGRFGYNRSDGPFIGADGVFVKIYDEDGAIDELLTTIVADQYGYFDTTFLWDPCPTFCDATPDIRVVFELNNAETTIKTTGGSLYSWQTGEWSDYVGTDLDIGTWGPGDAADDPAVHIFTNVIRTWRWLTNRGYDNPHLDCIWPNGAGGAWYSGAINVGVDRQWKEDTHAHEYGHHHVANFATPTAPSYCNGICDSPTKCGHCVWCQETATDAYAEGMPNWLADIVTRSFAGDYGLASQFTRSQENLQVCGATGLLDDPLLTEGFLGALLRDIEDSGQDNHAAFPGVTDALALSTYEILSVVDLDAPTTPMQFLNSFRARYPAYKEPLWETAANCGYQMDTANPLAVTGLTSTSHSTSGDSPDGTIDFVWTTAFDDASGIQGYGIAISLGSVVFPSAVQDIGDVTSYTTPQLSPGTYYFSIRALDRSGKWSSTYASSGPYTIRAAEPANLAFYPAGGWSDVVVPRGTTDASPSSVPTPTSLPGNANSTYLNMTGINNGESATTVGIETRLSVDGTWVYSLYWGTVGAGQWMVANNWGPLNVRGGRHTYEKELDSGEVISETNEMDNRWAKQWIWTPFGLSPNLPVSRSAPPDPIGGWESVSGTTWFNCDGLRTSPSGFWDAVTIRAENGAANYDARLHAASTGASDGFGGNVGWSARATGCLDALIMNRNWTNANYDVGVLNANGGGGNYVAAHRTSELMALETYHDESVGSGEMLLLREFWVEADHVGPLSVTVSIDPGDGPIHAAWLDASFVTGDLNDVSYITTTDETGKARLDFDVPAADYYCLVLYRDQKDGTHPMDVIYHVGTTPPDLTSHDPADWHSPLVPRPAFDGTAGSTPMPTSLPGNVASTYFNLGVQNASPSPATELPVHIMLDDVFIGWVAWGAFPANTSTTYNWNLAFTVRGGRHTLVQMLDPLDNQIEISELNNWWGEQWVWSPLDVPFDTPVTRPAPPGRTDGWDQITVPEPTWFNCDGLRTSGVVSSPNYWTGVAVMPNAGGDVNLRLHDVDTGTKNGFGLNYGLSGWGVDQSDFFIVNHNLVAATEYDVGVLEWNGPSGYTAEVVSAPYVDADPNTAYGPFTMGASEMLDLHEFWLEPGYYRLKLDLLNGSGDDFVDLGLSVYDATAPHLTKTNAKAMAYMAPENEDEWIHLEITQADYYCVAVWKVGSSDLPGTVQYALDFSNELTPVLDDEAPPTTVIGSVYPNPFNPRTTVSFALSKPGKVSLRVFDARGRAVATLVDRSLPAGRHEEVWDGRDDSGRTVSSGVYMAQLITDSGSSRRKMVMLK